jgi:hypothetical protein
MDLFSIFMQNVLADDASKISPDGDSDSSIAKNWEWSLAPMYLWAASIDGDLTVRGIEVDVNESFSDILDNLDGALMFHFEGLYKQRWGFIADLMYIRLNPDDESTPFGDISIGSDSTWNATGLITFKPWKHVAFGGGYRALHQDYSTRSGKER